jgi:hypothetical protein
MTPPSEMSLRRIPDELHLRVRIAYAAGWEALIESYGRQALEFVCEFAHRLPPLEALNLFSKVIAVPLEMQEEIACRTLIALDLESLPPLQRPPNLTGWQRLRPDLLLERQRARRRFDEATIELARMVGARATEAVISTHVENAVEFARLLRGVMPVNAATDRYLVEFALPAMMASMVGQRVRARVAGAELIAQYDEPVPGYPEPEASASPPAPPVSEAAPTADLVEAPLPAPEERPAPRISEEAPPLPDLPRLRIMP